MRNGCLLAAALLTALTTGVHIAAANNTPPDVKAAITEKALYRPVTSSPELALNPQYRISLIYRNFQAGVAGCMAHYGFIYTPETMPRAGWVTSIAPVTASDGTVSYDVSSVLKPGQSSPPLNGMRWAFMTTAERADYSMALRGQAVTTSQYDTSANDGMWSLETGVDPEDTGGCERAAREVIMEPARSAFIALAGPVQDTFAPVYDLQSLYDAETAWQNCMSLEGHDYVYLDDPAHEFRDEGEQAVAQGVAVGPGSAFAVHESSVATDDKACRTAAGVDAFRQNHVVPAWDDFVDDHYETLLVATGAQGWVGTN